MTKRGSNAPLVDEEILAAAVLHKASGSTQMRLAQHRLLDRWVNENPKADDAVMYRAQLVICRALGYLGFEHIENKP